MTSATPVYVTRLAALLCTLQVNASIPEDDVQALFAASDPEGLGKLDYEEFIAAMLDSSKVAKRQHVVRKSFEQVRPREPGGGERGRSGSFGAVPVLQGDTMLCGYFRMML